MLLNSSKNILELSGVYKSINNTSILTNINCRMFGGFIYGIVGNKDAGKTTLLKIISGIEKSDKGYIAINKEILGKDIFAPNSIGVLIDKPSFWKLCTGFNALKYIADIKGNITTENIRSTMIRVGLDPDSRKKIFRYSDELKQKLGIATAFLGNPDIILLDEPYSNLSEKSILLLHGLINEKKAQGRIVIVTSSNETMIERLTDEIYSIEKGKLIKNNKVELFNYREGNAVVFR